MMAEAPKSKTASEAAAAKAKAEAAKAAKPIVEDAKVISETPAKAATEVAKATAAPEAKPGAPAVKAAATSDPKTAQDVKPAAKPAEPKPAAPAKPTDVKPAPSKPAVKPAVKQADKPADKPAPKAAEPAKPASPAKPAPVAQKPEKKRGGFLGLLLGGAAAALIGFVAARTIVPEGWPFPGVTPKEDPLVGTVEAQGAEIVSLGEQLSAMDARIETLTSDSSGLDTLRDEMSTRLDGLEAGAGEITEQLGALETRLSSVEKLAPEGTEAAKTAAAAYERELSALREMFEGELAEIDAAQAETTALEAQLAENAQAAKGRAALAQVQAALDTGAPFGEALTDLAEATGVDAPEALAAVAAEGAPTLAALQTEFPAAAREAIDLATRGAVEDGSMSRMQAFLRTQLGTRTIAPKEGDDADAVLSRAEGALKTGDLAGVLSELDGLPEIAQPALADWRTQVQTRADALAAGKALAEELNAK